MIRDLRGVIEREGAAIGVFLTLTEPSRPMITEAAGAGQFTLPGTDLSVPRIQIVTIEQAMALRDRAVRVPLVQASHKRAAREEDAGRQGAMDL
jgi:site-specific DNA-methyltransferase (adenine-specific)